MGLWGSFTVCVMYFHTVEFKAPRMSCLEHVTRDWGTVDGTVSCSLRRTSCPRGSAFPAGAERDPGLPHLPHEAGPARPAPGGADPRRPVWQRRVPVRAGLFHPAAPSEDHRGGACHHRHPSRVRVHGAGGSAELGVGAAWGEPSQLRASESSPWSEVLTWAGAQEETGGPRGCDFSLV